MHWQAYQYITTVKSLLPEYFIGTSVLEIGAHDVNGGIRELFDTDKYVGVDLSAGEGVDVVISGHEYSSEILFDVTISCECFEHNPFYQETLDNMIEHTSEDGLIIFSCATTGRPEHGTTRTDPRLSPGTSSLGWDYYKNLTDEDFKCLQGKLAGWIYFTNKHSQDIYFIGTKSITLFDKIGSLQSKLEGYLDVFESISASMTSAEVFFPKLLDVEISPSLLFNLKHKSSNPQLIQNNFFQQFILNTYLYWPASWEVNYLLSELYRLKSKMDKALFFAHKATICCEHNSFTLNYYAGLLGDTGSYTKAISQLKYIKNFESNGAILFRASNYYLKINKYQDALLCINKAIDSQPENAIFLNNKLKVLVNMNEVEMALDCAGRIIAMTDCPKWIYVHSLKVINRLS
jgi:hypothetical protein